jgi:ABC-2 type transport system ATP-binding protein
VTLPAHPARRLALENLCVRRGDLEVIRGCDHVFAGGDVHGVVGHNGAGKTTLFEAIFGFIAPASGAITLDGCPLVRESVAYLPTDLVLYEGITGEELLRLFSRSGHSSDLARRYAHALEVPLGTLIDTYSFGMRRKLGLIAVVMLDRPVLLLDEPFEGLDVVSRRVVRHILTAEAARGRVVVYSAHELEALPTFSTCISLLRGGHFVGAYPTQSLAELERLLSTDVDERLQALQG